MKKNGRIVFINTIVFISCLALVEIFFVLNAQLNWVQPRKTDAIPVDSKTMRRSLPPELIEGLRLKYKDFTPHNSEFRDLFQEGRPVSYRNNPLGAGEFIMSFDRYPDIRKILHEAWDIVADKQLFAATYTFEGYGRRFVPGRPNPPARQNLVVVGCSQTFGIGVNDEQSMPYFLQERNPEYNVYNLGLEGAGLSELLDDALSGRRFEDLKKTPGVVVYMMFYDHIERTLCSMDCFRPGRDWIAAKNKYDFDSEGQLINLGPHAEAAPIKNWLYRLLGKSEFLKFVGYGHPRFYDEADLRLYVRLLNALKEIYAGWGYDFYLIPMNSDQDISDELAGLLEEYKIKYQVYDMTPLDSLRLSATILGEGHHNELGHDIMASLITQMLKDKPPKIPAVQASFSSEPDKN